MEPSTQKLIHTFGALADLGQEVASAGDFTEMVRTSLHLLLGTLALRRGAVAELVGEGNLQGVAVWGLDDGLLTKLSITDEDKAELRESHKALIVLEDESPFLKRHRDT